MGENMVGCPHSVGAVRIGTEHVEAEYVVVVPVGFRCGCSQCRVINMGPPQASGSATPTP